jgi:hypothetical protein
MDLRRITLKFLTETMTDPATNRTFLGSIRPMDNIGGSAPEARQRLLETAPDQAMFGSRVLSSDGQYFLIGTRNADYWRGAEIRAKYPLMPCDETTLTKGTILQVLTAAVPTTVIHGYVHHLSDTTMRVEKSELVPVFAIYVPATLSVNKRDVFIQGGRYYRCRGNSSISRAGFQVVEAMYNEAPVQSLTFVSQSGYSPTLDAITVSSTATVTAFVEDAYFAYDHTSERAQHVQPGDKTITVKPATTPKVGDTLSGYTILSVETESTCSVCHCRR